jgi:hypothetical protein
MDAMRVTDIELLDPGVEIEFSTENFVVYPYHLYDPVLDDQKIEKVWTKDCGLQRICGCVVERNPAPTGVFENENEETFYALYACFWSI